MDVESAKLNKLIQDAHKSGATELAIVSKKNIIVSNNLADKCREPQCENFGMSLSCPPHVSGPETFRKKLENFSQAIFFKIDVSSEILYSSDNMEFFQLLHEIASCIEHSAVKMGFTNAQAYAGGPCKKIFCDDHSECLALSEKGKCRHPKSARPSMSGFGINVGMLVKTVGWSGSEVNRGTDSTATKISNIYGLVLIN
jgi:predicted metal-binding protein